jgi:hypothetical protein
MPENKEKASKDRPVGFTEETRAHLEAARSAYRDSIKTFLPDDYFVHRRNARREMLLAARSMIDSAISRLEKF